MFGKLFSINLTETPSTYIISGIHGRDIGKFITSVWKTSVLETHMFKSVTGGRFGKLEFYKFFLIDVIYMFETLASRRSPRIPAKTLNEIVKILKENTWFKDVEHLNNKPSRLLKDRSKLFSYKLFPHQEGFVEYYDKTPAAYQLNGALLNASPGSGKTITSVYTMDLVGCDRIVIACPKNALDRVWVIDPNKFYKEPPKIWNSGMSTPPKGDEKLFVYHYEALDKVLEHHAKDFDKFNYGFILDESHNLNEIKSQRTQKWLDILKASKSKNIIHMSGTPLKAMGAESIPLFRAIDPLFTPQVEDKFKKIYGTSAQKGLDILKNRLGLVSYLVKKDELELDKPELKTVGIKVPDGTKYTLPTIKEMMREFIEERIRYYKDREEDDLAFYQECLETHEYSLGYDRQAIAKFKTYLSYIKRIQSTTEYGTVSEEISFCKRYEFNEISQSLPKNDVKEFRNVCSIIKYLPLKIQGECLGQVVGKMRSLAHVAMCEHIPFRDICDSTKKKTVVFTSFVDVLEEAKRVCEKQELNPIIVYAKTNKDLANIVANFDKDTKLNPLIATYNSLSTAVPLVMADTMIMINAPFRAYIQEQAIARIHRLGQDSKTIIYQLYLDTGEVPNISSRSLDIMKWSQEQVEAMTGVSSPYKLEDAEDGSVSVTTESYFDGELDRFYSITELNKIDIARLVEGV